MIIFLPGAYCNLLFATFAAPMPLAQIKKINSRTLLGRWTLQETISQLQTHPDLPASLILPETITHEKRRAEWLASRILAYQMLRHFTATTYTLENTTNGQPIFKSSPYQISISHTQQQVAVLLSEEYAVGIDIERVQQKVKRIQDKFLSLPEKLAIGDDLTALTIAWSAKETLYKLHGRKNIIFSENLRLLSFLPARSGSLEAFIQTTFLQQKYTVYFEVENDTVLTYCTAGKHQYPAPNT